MTRTTNDVIVLGFDSYHSPEAGRNVDYTTTTFTNAWRA